MGYATQADLEARYGAQEILQLSDRDNSGAADTGVIDRALADADAEINGYLASRYAVPVSPVPEILQRLACQIARYHLFTLGRPDDVTNDYKVAVRILSDISKGVITLGAQTGQVSPTADLVQMESGGRVFAREN